MDPIAIMAAVHQFDLNALSAEKVDILERILPSDEERKLFSSGVCDEETMGDEVCS